MKRIVALLLLSATAMSVLAGCNTVSGAGQDLSAGGNALSNTAEKHK